VASVLILGVRGTGIVTDESPPFVARTLAMPLSDEAVCAAVAAVAG
jgi:hypothetical protein